MEAKNDSNDTEIIDEKNTCTNAPQPVIVGQKPLVYDYDDAEASSNDQWSIDTSEVPSHTPSERISNQYENNMPNSNTSSQRELSPSARDVYNGNLIEHIPSSSETRTATVGEVNYTNPAKNGSVLDECSREAPDNLKMNNELISEEGKIIDIPDEREDIIDVSEEEEKIDNSSLVLDRNVEVDEQCDETTTPHDNETSIEVSEITRPKEQVKVSNQNPHYNTHQNENDVNSVELSVDTQCNKEQRDIVPDDLSAEGECSNDGENSRHSENIAEDSVEVWEIARSNPRVAHDDENVANGAEMLINHTEKSQNYHVLLEDWDAGAVNDEEKDDSGEPSGGTNDNIRPDDESCSKSEVTTVQTSEELEECTEEVYETAEDNPVAQDEIVEETSESCVASNNINRNSPHEIIAIHEIPIENLNTTYISVVEEADIEDIQVVEEKEDYIDEIDVVHTFSPPISNVVNNGNGTPQADQNDNDKYSIPLTYSKRVTARDIIEAIDLVHSKTPIDVSDVADEKRDEIIGILESESSDSPNSGASLPTTPRDDSGLKRGMVPYVMHTVDQKRVDAYARRGQRKRYSAIRPPKPLMDKVTERELALKQLASFTEKSNKKRRSTSAKDAPVVAAADLGRALASTPLLAGKSRKPCYKPNTTPEANIKTYSAKQKSNSTVPDVETGLQTIAIINKHLSDTESVEDADGKLPVKKIAKKRCPRELQQLLGDEGAVKMIYDTAHQDGQPVFKKTKKGLEQKTKYVEKAVIQLSGTAEKKLRGKRLKQNDSDSSPPSEPLFPPALPDQCQNSTPVERPRKKPKPAEASRILYRHSSSESFDGSEGMRRTPAEIAALDTSADLNKPQSPHKNDVSIQRKSSRPRKFNSKFSAYVAETLTPKRSRKSEDHHIQIKEEIVPVVVKEVSSKCVPDPQKTDAAETLQSIVDAPRIKMQAVQEEAGEDQREVEVTRTGNLVVLTLTSVRPRIKNSFTMEVFQQLEMELKSADNDPNCQAILFRTEGNVFCHGIDLTQMEPGSDVGLIINALRSFVTTLVSVEKPVVMGVQSTAVGLGVALLPLADVVIASEASTYSTYYSRLGQGLEAAASYTFPSIGKALVYELVYKGAILSATEAYHLGLVSQVVSAENFTDELMNAAEAVASQSCQGLRIAKSQIGQSHFNGVMDALERECPALEEAWTSAEWLAAAAELLASGEFHLHA